MGEQGQGSKRSRETDDDDDDSLLQEKIARSRAIAREVSNQIQIATKLARSIAIAREVSNQIQIATEIARDVSNEIQRGTEVAREVSNRSQGMQRVGPEPQPLYNKHKEDQNKKGKEIMKPRSSPRLKPRMRQRAVLSELMAERRRPQTTEGTSRNRPSKRREGTSRNRLPIPTKATSQTHVPDLPHEVLVEIFSRLPFDAFCRAKSLGKYWKSNLSPTVMKPHPMIMVQSTYSRSENPEVQKLEGLFGVQIRDSITNLDHWFKFANPPGKEVDIIGACKGILCLNIRQTDQYLIYNPATRESLEIPQPPYIPSKLPTTRPVEDFIKHGFGFSSSGQYKVVMFRWQQVTVLTVGTVRWRTYKMILNRDTVKRDWGDDWGMEGVYFDGCLHWIGKNTVIVFDLDEEYFEEFALPYNVKLQPEEEEDDGDDRTVAYSVGTLDNHLCVLVRSEEDEGSAEVHTMAAYGVDDSWESRKVIWAGDCNLQTRVLKYGRENQLLILHHGELGVISQDSNEIVRVEITKPPGTEKVMAIKTAFPFEPTLLTLDQAGFTILELPAPAPAGKPYVASDDSDDEVAIDFIDDAAADDDDYIDDVADDDFNF